MLRAERNHNRVIGRRCLQLEIERTTKTLSQCETPRPIDSAAERRVQSQLRPAGFVEETLNQQSLLRRNCAQRSIRVCEIIGELVSSGLWHWHRFGEPLSELCAAREHLSRFHV